MEKWKGSESRQRVIVLGFPSSPPVVLVNQHRGVTMETHEEIRRKISLLAQKHECAVLLTLVASPNNPKSVKELWEKFKEWLTDEFGTMPDHVVVHEYTSKGFVHIHAIICKEWLADRDVLTEQAINCGFTPINDVRKLIRTVDNGDFMFVITQSHQGIVLTSEQLAPCILGVV